MNGHDDAVTFGITAAEIAWPIVLVMCIAIMILPFVFLFLVKRGPDDDVAE